VAAEKSWTITVDTLAPESYRSIHRFFPEFAELSAEEMDALPVTDSDTSICPFAVSQSNLFAIPPHFLFRRFIAKA
jgi:hypothetical protein